MGDIASIDSYRRIASEQSPSGRTVANRRVITGEGGQLVSQGSAFGRIWRTSAQKTTDAQQNRKEFENFKAAITSAYGQEIADAVFGRESIGLTERWSKGANLSSRSIRRGLVYAEALQGSKRTNTIQDVSQLLAPEDTRLQHAFNEAGIQNPQWNDTTRNRMCNLVAAELAIKGSKLSDLSEEEQKGLLRSAANNLQKPGTTPQQISTDRRRLRQSENGALKLIAKSWDYGVQNSSILTEAVRNGSDAVLVAQNTASLVDRLSQTAAKLSDAIQHGNLSNDDKAACERLYSECLNMISVGLNRLNEVSPIINGPTRESLIVKSEILALDAGIAILENHEGDRPRNPQALQNARQELQNRKNELLKTRNSSVPLFSDDAGQRVRDRQASTIKTVKNALKSSGLSTKGLKKEFANAHVKARNEKQAWNPIETSTKYKTSNNIEKTVSHKLTPANLIPGLTGYEPSQGVCSDDRTSRHAQNLWVDKLSDREGTEMLTCVRSGVHGATKISDENERLIANRQRRDEAIVASLHANNVDLATIDTSEENPHEISIVDVGLLSRWDGEGKMQNEHFAVLDEVHDRPIQITVQVDEGEGLVPKQIWVRPQIVAFNFGERGIDKGMTGDMLEPSAWIERNRTSFGTLLNRAANYNGPNAQHVAQLREQLQQLRGDPNATNEGDYYAVAARVIVLSRLMGMVPNIHCKSGKDRTSRVIEEAKMLAAEIKDTGSVPVPGSLNRNRQNMLASFALTSGNAEVQQLNTGVAGNKQHGQFEKRITNPLVRDCYKGLQKFAKV